MFDTKVIIAIITAISGIVTIIVKKWLDNKKPISKKARVLTAEESDVFYFLDKLEIDICTGFKVPDTVTDNEAKQEVFKDIMINKIRIWKVLLVDLVKSVVCTGDCSKCGVSLIESRKLHMDTLSKGIALYADYYKQDNTYTKEQITALNICMPKFNNIHNPNAELVMDMIDITHTNAKYFKHFCPIMSMGLVLDSYKKAFYHMLHDVTDAIDNMNGDLKGLKFKRRNYNKQC